MTSLSIGFMRESSGHCPHMIEFFSENADFRGQSSPDLMLETRDYGSYSPDEIVVYAGTSAESYVEIKRMRLATEHAWVTLATAAEMTARVPNLFDTVQSFFKVEILSNHSIKLSNGGSLGSGGVNAKICRLQLNNHAVFGSPSVECTAANCRVSSGVVSVIPNPANFAYPLVAAALTPTPATVFMSPSIGLSFIWFQC